MADLSVAAPAPGPLLAEDERLAWRYVALGFLLGLPFAYPAVPYYWAAFAVFGTALLVTPFERFNRMPGMVLGVAALCLLAVVSNLFSPYPYVRDSERFVTSTTFYLFFLFGLLAWDREREILAGLAAAILLQALAVLAASVLRFRWGAGLANWAQPELRLWGQSLFPDWPNFYAILLCVGFLLFLLHYRRPLPAATCMLAAILTTSRVALVALGIALAWQVLFGPGRRLLARLVVALVLVGPVVAVVAMALSGSDRLEEFMERMSLLSDREEIWRSSLALFLDHPWFGVGGVMLDESVGHSGHASFHNSYAEILVRHGAVGFALYLWLLLAYAGRLRIAHAGTAILFFLLVTAVFQNTLRHPHFFMIYSFLVVAALRKDHD